MSLRMVATNAAFLRRNLPAYGVQNPTILDDATDPESIDYLDLLPSDAKRNSDTVVLPEAVAECQSRPLLYVVSKANLSNDLERYERELRQLRRTLGSRGERAYLGILEPGQLSVMPISLDDVFPEAVLYQKGTGKALTFFSRLSMGEYDGKGEPSSPDYVFDQMFHLLEHITNELAGRYNVDKDDVLSLIGRALFFRFLCDRRVVKPQSLRSIAPNADNLKNCFQTPKNATSTSAWLDRTFNGDFLPLTDYGDLAFFNRMGKKTGGDVFAHLSAILQGHEPAGGAAYQQVFEWAKFDFAHVPVGLLSQVYEAFSRRWSPDARETSVHYTPRRIADYLVEEAFADLPNAASARVLDPACGAGVFLVLAFRRLYQAKWRAEGDRPDTAAIREILERQLTGFEVSESALRLTALSLYLTAIELDPDPIPPSKLGFKNLRDRVLFNCRRADDPKDGPIIGSLGEHVGEKHNRAYDVVLCNPPWTSLKKEHKALAAEYTKISHDVLVRRSLGDLAKKYKNPDNTPDLPFIWRAMDWCKFNGRIGMVLPGRLLFKQEAIPCHARETLFKSLAVNGILNCSNLSDTPVWPKMSQPFLLLFAQNRSPKPDHQLRWVTPHCDLSLNRKGEVRIDSKSVQLVSIQSTLDEPWLWKALAIGTSLDVEVIRKVKATPAPPLLKYWQKDLGLESSNGYMIKPDQKKQFDARFLKNLPDLNSTKQFRFYVETRMLSLFRDNHKGQDTAARPRRESVYRGPITLFIESPSEDREGGLALLSLVDLAYNQRFHGYSAFGHPEGELLARYLHLFIHSQIWVHYALITSPLFGTERRCVYKGVLDECPIVPIERLDAEQRGAIRQLSERLISGNPRVFDDIDAFFASLYGLNKCDSEVIRDTIETSLPYKKTRSRSCQWPTPDERRRFAARLESSLRPFLRKLGKEVQVDLWKRPADLKTPYSVVLVGTDDNTVDFPENMFHVEMLPLANESGASRVILELTNSLAIAVLNQYRYWTPSRARLCAGEILLRHMAVFER